MNVSEVLNKAADHIEEFGHHKGTAAGAGLWPAVPLCMVGAIVRGSGYKNELHTEATGVMRDYLGRVAIVSWNDAPERTAAEVVEALRAAAVIAAAREVEVTVVAPLAEVS